ncbi:MAG TPA: alternative ribosome rescue aminoacyl-tRNA hydrolase ArfB [Fimbriiglobus sp.]|nr:alternative ribosome rescue aminoacyl-tRNA hydrolase ArfB [Fimbriiglobus sp.]
MLQITPAIAIPDAELSWAYARSGGPGGQNVNKVASKVVLRWALDASPSVPPAVKDRIRAAHPSYVTTDGDLLVTSEKFRDQGRNREDCLAKLAAMIRRAATPPKPRKPTKPTKGSKTRRLAAKKQQSERKAGRRPPGTDY